MILTVAAIFVLGWGASFVLGWRHARTPFYQPKYLRAGECGAFAPGWYVMVGRTVSGPHRSPEDAQSARLGEADHAEHG